MIAAAKFLCASSMASAPFKAPVTFFALRLRAALVCTCIAIESPITLTEHYGYRFVPIGKRKTFVGPPVFQRIDNPELFIGIVAPIGTNISEAAECLESSFKSFGYDVVHIRVTDYFREFKNQIPRLPNLDDSGRYQRYSSYIRFGDALRDCFSNDAIMASLAVVSIVENRASVIKGRQDRGLTGDAGQKVVYVIRQFKRKEETDLLRSVYGRLFFQLSSYAHRPSRVDALARTFASSDFSASPNSYRELAEKLVQIDEDEVEDDHGQRVSDIFHDADAIVSADSISTSVQDQVQRFVRLLFGSNSLSPTKQEYGIYAAKSASLRSLDLSRQVGAAIFSQNGEIISMGANEVPKAGGGTYWCDDGFDARDYTKGQDWNQKRKTEILSELVGLLFDKDEIANIVSREDISNSQFMDALEYGRMIHAEMSAITDAARKGLPLRNGTLFCTTFPCHMCAKHIVAAGIEKVVFLEPYPKSLANELNGDSLDIEGQYRGEYARYPSVQFCHFHGISPRVYRDMFERKKRKDKTGQVAEWKLGEAKPVIDIFIPNYLTNEVSLNDLTVAALKKAGINPKKIFRTIASAEPFFANSPSIAGKSASINKPRQPPDITRRQKHRGNAPSKPSRLRKPKDSDR